MHDAMPGEVELVRAERGGEWHLVEWLPPLTPEAQRQMDDEIMRALDEGEG